MIEFSVFKNKHDAKNGIRYLISVEECLDKFFTTHRVTPGITQTKEQLELEKNGPNFNLGHYINTREVAGKFTVVHRSTENITGVYGIGFDIDNNDANAPHLEIEEVTQLFEDYTYVIYTTHSHLLEDNKPKFRIVLFFDKLLNSELYTKVWNHFRSMFPDNNNVDKSCKDTARFWYLPSCPRNNAHSATIIKNISKLINIEEMLEEIEKKLVMKIADDDRSTDQRFSTHEDFITTSIPLYTATIQKVKEKDIVSNKNYTESLKSNLKTTNTATRTYNDEQSIHTRVLRVLNEPAMHVTNFTGNNYQDWIVIGSAIKGEGLPFELFDEWSSKDSVKYNEAGGSAGLYKRWNGLNGSAKAGTIFSLAKERGVKFHLGYSLDEKKTPKRTYNQAQVKSETPDEDYDRDNGDILSYEDSLKVKPRQVDFNKEHIFPAKLALRAPGLVGEYMQYVLDSSRNPNPQLSLANSIATIAALYHQRIVHTYDMCCPNVYIMGLGRSSIGKTQAFLCSEALFNKIGAPRGSQPKSSEGLITELKSLDGNMFLLIDEFEEKFLKPITSKNSGPHMTMIVAELLDYYSKGNQVVLSKAGYADEEKNKKIPIANPHLTIYGACVHQDFYRHYRTNNTANGFMARFIPFITSDIMPPDVEEPKSFLDIPHALVEKCRRIYNMPIRKVGEGLDVQIVRQVIDFDSPETKTYHRKMTREFQNRMSGQNPGEAKDYQLNALYGKTGQNALKIAMVAREGNTVTRAVLEWAYEVVEASLESIIKNVYHEGAENQFDSMCRKLEGMIVAKGAWITKRELANSFRQDIKTKEALLDYLVQAGRIVKRQALRTSSKSKRSQTEYMAI